MPVTTQPIGEEDPTTTRIAGEEGDTTHAEGEEDPSTTIIVGEEDSTHGEPGDNPFGSF